MTREEANIQAKRIFEEWSNEKDRITKEAKEKGIWNDYGLDTNNHLFKELDNQVKEKLNALKAKIDK